MIYVFSYFTFWLKFYSSCIYDLLVFITQGIHFKALPTNIFQMSMHSYFDIIFVYSASYMKLNQTNIFSRLPYLESDLLCNPYFVQWCYLYMKVSSRNFVYYITYVSALLLKEYPFILSNIYDIKYYLFIYSPLLRVVKSESFTVYIMCDSSILYLPKSQFFLTALNRNNIKPH